MPQINDDLADLIRAAGSQRRLADIIGVAEETVSRWVNGTRSVPPFVTVILELLNATPRSSWPDKWKWRKRVSRE